jgi:sugar lactone lactonase YvrE
MEAESQVIRSLVQSNDSCTRGWNPWRAACLAASVLALLPALGLAQVAPTYTIATAVGTGTAGFAGDGGAATSAELNYPTGIAFDSSGNLYIADHVNHRIRKVDTSGNISTIAGDGTLGYLGDSAAATSAELDSPCGVAVDSSGNVYIADTLNHVIRKVAGGTITTFAGDQSLGSGYSGDTAAATAAQLNTPVGIVVDSAGNVWIADTGNSVIREVTTDGNINTIIGNSYADYGGDGGPAIASSLNHPLGLALDAAGNLYIADQLNQRIRMVAATKGVITTTSIITTVAGNGILASKDTGTLAIDAGLSDPSWVAVDSAGNLFIADLVNNIVRRVAAADGTIATVAGNGQFGVYGDGGPALQAAITFPLSVAVNAAGKVYVAQGENNVIRVLTPVATTGSDARRHGTRSIEVLPRPRTESPLASTIEGE